MLVRGLPQGVKRAKRCANLPLSSRASLPLRGCSRISSQTASIPCNQPRAHPVPFWWFFSTCLVAPPPQFLADMRQQAFFIALLWLAIPQESHASSGLRANVAAPPASSANAVAWDIKQRLAATPGNLVSVSVGNHTALHLRRTESTAWCRQGQIVPCLSLTNIVVGSAHRRRGHARRTLEALHVACADEQLVLLVENVVSEHMHTIIDELNGEPLPGSRAGRRGASYWVPSDPKIAFTEMARIAT